MSKKVLGIIMGVVILGLLVSPVNAVLVRDTLYSENLNGEWSTTSPPSGWTIIYTGSVGNSDWHRYTSTVSGHPGPLARLYWSPSETGVDRFISPVIDVTTNPKVEQVIFRTWHLFDDYGGTYTAQIRGSNDGGSNYNQIIIDYRTEGITLGPGDYEDFDISTWALGQNDVSIEYYADGYSYNIDNWYWDDFMVMAQYDSATGGPGGEADFELVQIVRPLLEEEPSVAFKPACKVLLLAEEEEPNMAASPAPAVEALVRCRIRNLTTQQNVYEDVYTAYPFEPGYNDVSFKNFTPEGGASYEAVFAVEYAEDPTPDNNDKSRRFTTGVGVQVDAVDVLAPVGEVYVPFDPSCKFKEMVSLETPAVMLRYSIDNDAVIDSLEHNFSADEEYTATFATVEGLANGDHTIRFYATDSKGDEIGDYKEVTFTYTAIAEEPEVAKFDLSVSARNVSFSLDKNSSVTLAVYDVAGNLVTTLASGNYTAGEHSVIWNGDAASGLYFVRLTTPDRSTVRKLTLLQ